VSQAIEELTECLSFWENRLNLIYEWYLEGCSRGNFQGGFSRRSRFTNCCLLAQAIKERLLIAIEKYKAAKKAATGTTGASCPTGCYPQKGNNSLWAP
jgi:hypothetical protein